MAVPEMYQRQSFSAFLTVFAILELNNFPWIQEGVEVQVPPASLERVTYDSRTREGGSLWWTPVDLTMPYC
jgi:hypothetical protein